MILGLRDYFKAQKKAQSVQTASENAHPFDAWMGYQPLATPDCALYDAMREAVPVIDAALDKIVRLTGGFYVLCSDKSRQYELDAFVNNVRVGPCSFGLHQFIGVYLSSLLTYGNAVGEIVLTQDGRGVLALYNARLSDVHVRQGKTPLDVEICASRDGIKFAPVPYPELVLFTPLMPPAGEVRGVPLLRSLPFVTGILLKIFHSTGVNFQRVANLRYAVTYRPGASGVDRAHAKDIADGIAREWSSAMDSAQSGVIRDFVAVGDVDIKVIGADNQMLDTEIPVRQMLEQIVAKLGIPPFMLGLHWSSTERMSAQQADILTSELESYRRLLDTVVLRICGLWMRLRGYSSDLHVEWDTINLQDQVEEANARLLNARAAVIERTGGDSSEIFTD